jgi:primosomal replication protein N
MSIPLLETFMGWSRKSLKNTLTSVGHRREIHGFLGSETRKSKMDILKMSKMQNRIAYP